MITEDYVSFETAKLLKEKGFDEPCDRVYMHDGKCVCAPNFMEGENFVDNDDIDAVKRYDESNWIDYIQGEYAYLCPSISLATKWLREVHNIHIDIAYNMGYFPICISTKTNDTIPYIPMGKPFTYEKACEVAIKYCLEYLI